VVKQAPFGRDDYAAIGGMTTRRGEQTPLQGRIVGECPVPLWGLRSEERIRRQLRSVGVEVARGETQGGPSDRVLLLRADRLYDLRTIRDLAARPGTLLVQPEGGESAVVAAHVPIAVAAAAEKALLGERREPIPEVAEVRTEDLSPAYLAELLKSEPVKIIAIRADRRVQLERRLFDGSYKGVTDLVTKFVWPAPARAVTRVCAQHGVTPNAITWLSVILVVLATWEFAYGRFGTGLVLAWLMTFLDTVDGKLARVTVQSSRFGHFLDHGLDLVHPPFWYLAWGLGLASSSTPIGNAAMIAAVAAIFVGYWVGRLAEAAFGYWMARFSMFCWRPIDSYVRLVLARRNPNLILLTVALLAGRPDVGLIAVAVWTVLSSVFLLVRLAMAAVHRRRRPLKPWLDDPVVAARRSPFSSSRAVDEAA
jgi:phosphatidylglycerophosphate synthase